MSRVNILFSSMKWLKKQQIIHRNVKETERDGVVVRQCLQRKGRKMLAKWVLTLISEWFRWLMVLIDFVWRTVIIYNLLLYNFIWAHFGAEVWKKYLNKVICSILTAFNAFWNLIITHYYNNSIRLQTLANKHIMVLPTHTKHKF